MSSIKLDAKHGAAPTLLHCPVCLESSGIALPGTKVRKMAAEAKKSPEAFMREGLMDNKPCTKCQGYMQQGIILIGVDEEKTTDKSNPWRTGRFTVIKEDAIRRIFGEGENVEAICKNRVAYMPEEVFVELGIPEEYDPSKEDPDDS